MINAVVKPRKDGLYDFAFYDGSNGNLLSSSDQGYENAIDAETMCRRLAPAGELVHLAVRHLDGTSKTETLNPGPEAVEQADGSIAFYQSDLPTFRRMSALYTRLAGEDGDSGAKTVHRIVADVTTRLVKAMEEKLTPGGEL